MVGARNFLRILAPLQLQQFPNHKGANNGCDKLNYAKIMPIELPKCSNVVAAHGLWKINLLF